MKQKTFIIDNQPNLSWFFEETTELRLAVHVGCPPSP